MTVDGNQDETAFPAEGLVASVLDAQVPPAAGSAADGPSSDLPSAGPLPAGPLPDGPVHAGPVPAGPPAAVAVGTWVDWLLVVLITVLAACSAVVALAFLPLYVGSVPLPLSALLGVATMTLAPRACYQLTHSLIAALLPVAAWFGVLVWLVLSRNTLMPGLPLTVIDGQWRVMVLLGLGSLAAAATVGLIWGDRLRDRVAAEQAAARARDEEWVAGASSGRG